MGDQHISTIIIALEEETPNQELLSSVGIVGQPIFFHTIVQIKVKLIIKTMKMKK